MKKVAIRTRKKIEGEKRKYCRECGEKLQAKNVNAHETKVWFYDGMGSSLFRLDSPYSMETGIMNTAIQLKCPKWRRFFNSHDKIIIYEGDYYYL